MSFPDQLEAPVHSAEKENVLKVLRSARDAVRPSDVSRQTGLPVLRVTYWLNKIASETGGHLIVDTAGGVAYKFQSGFESAYLLKGTGTLLQRAKRIVINSTLITLRFFCLAMFFLLRISFGILLVLSVVLVVVLIVVVVLRLLSGNSDNDDGGGFDFSGIFQGGWLRYWTFDWLWDWFYWSRYISWDPYHQPLPQREAPDTLKSTGTKSNFLDNCFTLLFGYGDPNPELEHKRWSMIAQAIQKHRGVVVAEQLAPYADEPTASEDWMLPILVRFNGVPDVTESGTIIYSFPEFQRGAVPSSADANSSLTVAEQQSSDEALRNIYSRFVARQGDQVSAAKAGFMLPAYLKEELWKFCELSAGSITAIAAFAAVATLGSAALMLFAAKMSFLAAFTPVLVAIFVYGLMFAVIPGIRWLLEQRMNEKIERRNQVRYQQAQRLSTAAQEPEVLKRLEEASAARAAGTATGVSLAYTTEGDLLDQEFRNAEAGLPQAGSDAGSGKSGGGEIIQLPKRKMHDLSKRQTDSED